MYGLLLPVDNNFGNDFKSKLYLITFSDLCLCTCKINLLI